MEYRGLEGCFRGFVEGSAEFMSPSDSGHFLEQCQHDSVTHASAFVESTVSFIREFVQDGRRVQESPIIESLCHYLEQSVGF